MAYGSSSHCGATLRSLSGNRGSVGVLASASTAYSPGSEVTSRVVDIGEADRCFLLGTLGGEGSSRVLRLFRGSGSVSRFDRGVGSEVEAPGLTGEPAVPGQGCGVEVSV